MSACMRIINIGRRLSKAICDLDRKEMRMIVKVLVCFIVKVVSECMLLFCYVVTKDEDRKGIKWFAILFETVAALPIYCIFRAAQFKHPLLWTFLGYSPIWHAGFKAVTELISKRQRGC